MTKRTATQLSEPLTLEVSFADGKVAEYRTSPIDVCRTEDFFGLGSDQLQGNYRALAYMAYSVALRRGDAYRTRKASTDKREAFYNWLENVDNVAVISYEDEGEADPKDGSPPAGSELPSE